MTLFDTVWHSQHHLCDHFCSQRVEKLVYYEKMSSYWDLLTYYIIHLWIIYCIFVVQWYRNTFIRVKSPFKTSIILVSDSLTNLIVWFFTEHLSWFCSYPQTWSELDPNPTRFQNSSFSFVLSWKIMIQECSSSGLRNFNVRMKWNLYHFRLTNKNMH